MDPIGLQVDQFGTLPTTHANVQMFNTPTVWDTWRKPPGATMCSIIAIGGGGGGAAGQATLGQAGGGSSGIARLLIPAFFLPDILYVQVGAGGAGGAAASALGSNGALSYVSFGHSINAPNVLLQSGAAAAQGGQAATGGTASTIATVAVGGALGSFFAIAGQPGTAAGANANAAGVPVTAWGSVPLSGGCGSGGNGTNPTGGAQLATAAVDWGEGPTIAAAGTIIAGGAANASGNAGYGRWIPFFQTGGTSSGGNAGGTVTGGEGGIGSGGGAGAANANRGGDGGNGLVVITSW